MGEITISDDAVITGVYAGIQLIAGSLTVSDNATITATATEEQVSENANSVANKTGDGAIADGAAISIINRSGYGNTTTGGSTSYDGVTISGGTITSADGVDAVQAYTYSSNTATATTEGVSITGGTYSTDVSAYVDETAYTIITNDDGTKTVVSGEHVAAIGTTYYTTLTAAFAAVQDGETITLLQSVTTSDAEYNGSGLYQVSGKAVTLDLDEYTLTVDTTRVFGVLNGGALTVKDGNVAIAEDTTETYTQFIIMRSTGSTFKAENVTFDGNNVSSNFIQTATDCVATIALTNCDIENEGGSVVYDADGNSEVMLTGCNYSIRPIYCPSGNGVDKYTIVLTENNVITEGSGNYESDHALYYSYVVAEGGSITRSTTLSMGTTYGAASLLVDGGEVNADVSVAAGTSMTVDSGTVTGTITVKASSTEGVSDGELTIEDGTVKGKINTFGTFTMTDGAVENTADDANEVIMVNGGSVDIKGGTVTNNASAQYARAIVFAATGTITGTITNGTFTSVGDAALLARANDTNTVEISGGVYTATTGLYLIQDLLADGYGVYDTDYSEVTANSSSQYRSSLDDKTVYVMTADAVSVAAEMFGKNIKLENGTITLNVYVKSTDGNVESAESITASLEDEDDTSRTTVGESDKDDYTYMVTQQISAEKMANSLTVAVTLSDETVVYYTTSVKDYANDYMEQNPDDEDSAAVLKAMLNYGAALQEYSGYNTSDLANDGNEVTNNTSTDDMNTAGVKLTTNTQTDYDGAKLSTMNLVLSYEFTVKLTYDSDIEGAGTAVTLNGVTLTKDVDYTVSGKVISISGLSAQQLKQKISVTTVDSTGYKRKTNLPGLYYAYLLAISEDTTAEPGSDALRLQHCR